ncbi:MAG: adenylyl-sulfate kinase [Promethearchaeota archaeon]
MEHKGFTLWFTGLPCSGKTTLADAVAEDLRARGMKVERLDGDIVRKSLTRDLGFSKEDRKKNIERVTFVAKLLTRNGVAVLCTFVSPYNEIRERSRKEIGEYILVYVKCPVEVCEQRDVKGMYAKARRGEITGFTGVDDPFEEPINPEIIVETDKQTVEESKKIIINWLDKHGYLL